MNCKVAEGLYNLWSLSSGQGSRERIPAIFAAVNRIAEDACQVDDFIVGVTAALLSRQGAKVDIRSVDSRFFGEVIELPQIRYPFYMVVQTHVKRIGIPVYQPAFFYLARV